MYLANNVKVILKFGLTEKVLQSTVIDNAQE